MFKKLKNFVYTSKEKAFVAFWSSGVSAYVAQSGFTVKQLWSWHGVWALAVGVLTHQIVYWTQNSGRA